MLNTGDLSEGTILDHIKTGKSLDIYYQLDPNKLDSQTAIIKNIHSQKMGGKGIIKVEGDALDRIDSDALGYVDHSTTASIIRDSKIIEKRVLRLLEQITNVIHRKNLHYITPIEQEFLHILHLSDPERKIYRHRHCSERHTDKTR